MEHGGQQQRQQVGFQTEANPLGQVAGWTPAPSEVVTGLLSQQGLSLRGMEEGRRLPPRRGCSAPCRRKVKVTPSQKAPNSLTEAKLAESGRGRIWAKYQAARKRCVEHQSSQQGGGTPHHLEGGVTELPDVHVMHDQCATPEAAVAVLISEDEETFGKVAAA
jgi:hypothetical protein